MNEPWTAQVNDIIGGWIVTRYPRRLSEHPYFSSRSPQRKNDVVIAECMTEADAQRIADALNKAEDNEKAESEA